MSLKIPKNTLMLPDSVKLAIVLANSFKNSPKTVRPPPDVNLSAASPSRITASFILSKKPPKSSLAPILPKTLKSSPIIDKTFPAFVTTPTKKVFIPSAFSSAVANSLNFKLAASSLSKSKSIAPPGLFIAAVSPPRPLKKFPKILPILANTSAALSNLFLSFSVAPSAFKVCFQPSVTVSIHFPNLRIVVSAASKSTKKTS